MSSWPKIAWVVPKIDTTNGAFYARVHLPHLRLLAQGFTSTIFNSSVSLRQLNEFDAVIFHRTMDLINPCVRSGKIVGLDIADDLFKLSIYRKRQHFTLTDSLPNVRNYFSPNTFYWPHGFEMKEKPERKKGDVHTRFVYCGYAENVSCLLGDPIDALEEIGKEKSISLTIISNIKNPTETWLAKTPSIKAKNFSIDWKEWTFDTYEQEMQKCDAGIFPQLIEKDRWRSKSIYKAAHAASLGIPSILSPSEEAFSNFTNGITAMLPTTREQWGSAVRQMTDSMFRMNVARNVSELCRLRFNLDVIVQQLIGIIGLYRGLGHFPDFSRLFPNRIIYVQKLVSHFGSAFVRRLGKSRQ